MAPVSRRETFTATLAAFHAEVSRLAGCPTASEGTFYPLLADLLVELSEGLGTPVDALPLPRLGGDLCPDLQIVTRAGGVVGYVEVKPPGSNLRTILRTRQIARYRAAFPNLLLTDCRTSYLLRGTEEKPWFE